MPSRPSPRLPAPLLPCLAAALMLGLWACGNDNKQLIPKPICHDQLTGNCIPCPDVQGCVDPVSCVPTPCAGSDISFDQDTTSADTSGDTAGDVVQQVDAGELQKASTHYVAKQVAGNVASDSLH